jgi:hypothetical protein
MGLLRFIALARAPVQLAEAEVAVGDERAHAQLFGEGVVRDHFVAAVRTGASAFGSKASHARERHGKRRKAVQSVRQDSWL